jgi:hypothetical protein
VGTDVLKIGTQGKGGERMTLPCAGTSRVMTFSGGAKRWAHRVLPKEEKKVKDGEFVVRHGGGDRRLPVARQSALEDTVALAKSLHNCLEEQKKRCQAWGEGFLGGADMVDSEVSDGKGKVCERGTHGYGLVHRRQV